MLYIWGFILKIQISPLVSCIKSFLLLSFRLPYSLVGLFSDQIEPPDEYIVSQTTFLES